MKMLLTLWLCALVAAASAESAPGGMQLFLLVGQSNMAGRGPVEPQDEIVHPRVFMFTKERQWLPAKDPVHFDKPVAGVGPCSEFARVLVKGDPKIVVGLIPCAVGGTSLDEWKPGGKLYTAAIERARAAMKNGVLAGILWHQGEADSAPEKVSSYADRFAAMIGQLRRDLNAPDVPVVIGELGRFRVASAGFNANLPAVSSRVPRCALATAEELGDKGDHLHFSSAAQRLLGQRYAAAYLRLNLKK